MTIALKASYAVILIAAMLVSNFVKAIGQDTIERKILQLCKVIEMPGVIGDINHIQINVDDQLVYIAASENNSISIIDLTNGLTRNIEGIYEPKSVTFLPQSKELFITTNGNRCYFYSSITFKKTGSIRLMAPANIALYESAERKIYVAYGDDGLLIINSDTHKETGFRLLPGRAEQLDFDKARGVLYINFPESYLTGVLDLSIMKLKHKWPSYNTLVSQMAIDTLNNRLFICYKKPPSLVVMNGKTGKRKEINIDIDDIKNLYYEANSKRIFLNGTESIHIFQDSDTGFKEISTIKIPVAPDLSLLVPELNLFLVVKEATLKKNAELLIYEIMALRS
jgi:hypothetical protein